MTDRRSIRLDSFLPYPPARVWKALTDPDLLARWLMPNDFRLEVGHRFTFKTAPKPIVRFDGTVHCEVLGYEAERLLCYTWSGRGENGLRSTVTWRLEPEGGGTRLYLEHDGFDPNSWVEQLSRRMMGKGWTPVMRRIGALLATESARMTPEQDT